MAAAWLLSKQKKARFRIQGLLLFCFSSSASLVLAPSTNAWTKDGRETAPEYRKKVPLGDSGLPASLLLCISSSTSLVRASSNNAWTKNSHGTAPGDKRRPSTRYSRNALPSWLVPRLRKL